MLVLLGTYFNNLNKSDWFGPQLQKINAKFLENAWDSSLEITSQMRKVFFFNYALQPFKAYCVIWVGRFNFRHQASPRVSQRESTQRRKVELWARNVR